MKELQIELDRLEKTVQKLLEQRINTLNEYDIKALRFIVRYLHELNFECKTGDLKQKSQRFSHMARLLSDKDGSVINSELGKRLIDVEIKYMTIDN